MEWAPQGPCCEAHLIEGRDGVIRLYARKREYLHYSESADGGRTWCPIRETKIPGSDNPPFLSRLSDGRALLTYGSRQRERIGVYARIGDENGSLASFEAARDVTLYRGTDGDMGYASTAQLPDGSLVTAFYAHHTHEKGQAQIVAVKWRLPK